MQDDNWELVNGPAAHAIEFINYSNQINVIEALVMFYEERAGGKPLSCPTARILTEIHRTGTLFLLDEPGKYRENYEVVVAKGEQVVYSAPSWKEVENLMTEFHDELAAMWSNAGAVEVAAFALWRVCWIHPFRNGNGRTARAFSYACLCLKCGSFLPGTPTVLDQIMTNRNPYENALWAADQSYEKTGKPDLTPMQAYLADLLINQIKSISP